MSKSIEQTDEKDMAVNDITASQTSEVHALLRDDMGTRDGVLSGKRVSAKSTPWRQVLGLAMLGFLFIFGYAWWKTHSFVSAWSYISGQRVFASPSSINLGEVKKTDTIEAEIHVTNLDSIQHTLLGADKSCGCISVGPFPITISPAGKQTILVRFRPTKVEKAFEHEILLFTDDSQLSSIRVYIAGVAR